MRGAADMLHHIERRQYITKATTVLVSCHLKPDIEVAAYYNRTCVND